MKKIILFLILFSPIIVFAQDSIVYWTTKATKIKNNLYEVEYTATIKDQYMIFSKDNNPSICTPTTFFNVTNLLIESYPVLEYGPLYTKQDEKTKIFINYFKDKVTFKQLIKFKGDFTSEYELRIYYQACTESNCLPIETKILKISL